MPLTACSSSRPPGTSGPTVSAMRRMWSWRAWNRSWPPLRLLGDVSQIWAVGQVTTDSIACLTVPAILHSPARLFSECVREPSPNPPKREAVLLEVVGLAARLASANEAVLQLHLGARRDISPRLFSQLGRDAGGDAMGDERQGPGLVRMLGELEAEERIPRTVLYNANPADNELFATLAGVFSRTGVDTLVQWGPAWWFNDHEDGMRRQLDVLSESGLLAGFIGMVTDSRSLLSMTSPRAFSPDTLRCHRLRRRQRTDPR